MSKSVRGGRHKTGTAVHTESWRAGAGRAERGQRNAQKSYDRRALISIVRPAQASPVMTLSHSRAYLRSMATLIGRHGHPTVISWTMKLRYVRMDSHHGHLVRKEERLEQSPTRLCQEGSSTALVVKHSVLVTFLCSVSAVSKHHDQGNMEK